jgi:hypothetical protein
LAGQRDKFQKIVAIAMDPGAFEDEAIAALRKARELIKKDPTLKEPEPKPPAVEAPQASYKSRITNVHAGWLDILMNSLSQEAYGLGLRSKITREFSTPAAVEVRCDGSEVACRKFEAHVDWVIQYINHKVSGK